MQSDAALYTATDSRSSLEATAERVVNGEHVIIGAEWTASDAHLKLETLALEVCNKNRAKYTFKDDLLADLQEEVKEQLGDDDRAVLGGDVQGFALRSLVDDSTYALQMAAYAAGKEPPPLKHWRRRPGDTVRLSGLIITAAATTVSIAVLGIVTSPIWLTILLLTRLRSMRTQRGVDNTSVSLSVLRDEFGGYCSEFEEDEGNSGGFASPSAHSQEQALSNDTLVNGEQLLDTFLNGCNSDMGDNTSSWIQYLA